MHKDIEHGDTTGVIAFLCKRTLFWAPVWIPMIVVYQLVLGGLEPTREEGDRIRASEAEVRARVESLEEQRDELETRRDMLRDPVYRARVDRTRKRADRDPLTLDEARELAESAAE